MLSFSSREELFILLVYLYYNSVAFKRPTSRPREVSNPCDRELEYLYSQPCEPIKVTPQSLGK